MAYHSKFKKTSQKPQKEHFILRKTFIHASRKISMQSIIFYCLLMIMLPLCSAQDFTTNLIINGNFSEPKLKGNFKNIPLSIKGWSCSQICELKNCDRERKLWLTRNLFDSDCTGQVIDLNSNNINEVVTQTLDLTAGKYLLHFNYFYPAQASRRKQMKVTLNSQILLYVWPQVNYSFDIFYYESVIEAIQGQNVLAFANLGLNDGNGFKINNVSLYRVTDNNLIDWLNILSAKFSEINTCPGFRVVFRNMLSFMINFDRLELYIYHNRRYSYNIQLLLVAVNKFLNMKSNAAIGILELLNKDGTKKMGAFKNKIQFKQGYSSYPSFSQDYAGVSYLDNLNESLVYFIPFVLLLLLILNILFSLSFHSPISLAFRKYSLWAIALVMIFDGNIENLTFFTLTEFKAYFSLSLSHKALNVFILFMFFLLIFIAFGLLHWGKFHYKKKVKFLLDEQNSKMALLWGIIIDRGILCFLFGAIHCILLESPFIQLIILVVLEILWIVKKIVFINKGLCEQKYLILASILNGSNRVFFQISCLIYDSHSDLRIHINEVVNAYLIYSILWFSFVQFAVGCAYTIRSIWKILSKKSQIKVEDFNNQLRLLTNLIKEKDYNAEDKYKKMKIDHGHPKEERLNYKTLPKRGFQSSNQNIEEVDFYLRRQRNKVTVGHIAFQTTGIVQTRRTRIRKYQK